MPDKIDAAEYNEGVYKIADNIETAEDKRIAVFSSNPEIARTLGELNKAIVINHNMSDMMRELIAEHGEIEIIASLNLTENDSIAIHCDDRVLSDFMSAFMRMHGTRAYCNPLDLEIEDSGKKLIRIDIPGSHKDKLSIFIDGMASFLDGNLYLFNKKLYASREEWERDMSLMLRSLLSNIKGMFKTITPESINSAVNSTLAKVDPRYTNKAVSVIKNVVDNIKKEVELAGKKAEMEIAKEKKLLKAEKTNIQKHLLPTENALQELKKERELITDNKGELETKVQKLEAGRRQMGLQKRELEKSLAEYEEKRAKYRDEQKELDRAIDSVKSERQGVENELLQLQRLKEELEKERRELPERRAEAEKLASELEGEKSLIFKEKFRLTQLLSKLGKEKTDVDVEKSGLEGLRGKIKLKRKKKATKKDVKKIYKPKTKRKLKPKLVVSPTHVGKKRTKKYKRLRKQSKPTVEITPKPEEPMPSPILGHSAQRTGFYRLKAKLDRYAIHKRKRLGARITEKGEI